MARILPLTLPLSDPAALMAALPPGPGQFLLESGPFGPRDVRRYSFAGAEPFLTLKARGQEIYIHEAGRTRIVQGDPLLLLQSLLDSNRVEAPPNLPGFPGGAVGYIGYDVGRQIEHLPSLATDDMELPDLSLSFYDVILSHDHITTQTALIIGAPAGRQAEATAKARRWAASLKQALPLAPPPLKMADCRIASTFTHAEYCQAIQKAMAYIAAGDIYQVNLSQRLTCRLAGTGWDLYRRLRETSPAPFAAFLQMGSWQVVSASPERFLTVQGRKIESRPIKGTRPRGSTPAEDEANAAALQASEKDAAELVMIVDLQRNDLGRISEYGSVHVPDQRRLEATPHVWHTVATVEGRLKADATTSRILQATFPGGSITGAPKIRAMEIIEEIEPVRRGLYTGSIGYIGFDGQMDLNIAIRTAVVKEGRVTFHVGGGVVADSDPEAEYQETIAKAAGLANALGVNLDDLP